jgi:excisionase family DNA binding protein
MHKQAKAPVGRPRIELDAKQAGIFGYFRATYETMAEYLGCHYDTIRRAMQDDESEFCKAYKKSYAGMKMKLSEAQIKTALEDRNATLLIWLGKQYLGQKDTIEVETSKTNVVVRMIPHKLADDSGANDGSNSTNN